MKKLNNNNGAYSVIAVLLIIGFLLVLTTGIFNTILNEMKDNRGMGGYIKSFAGAESAQELALLQIKENGYAFYDKIDHNVNNRSILLSSNNMDKSKYNKNKDVFISYDIGSKVKEFTGELDALGYSIIPLFYINNDGEQKVLQIDIVIDSGTKTDLSWNIVGKKEGLSGSSTNVKGVKKTIDSNGSLKYEEQNIDDFLSSSETNYLILFNSGNEGIIKYTIKSNNPFSKPKTTIISSAQIGGYKQNLSTILDNTEFLNMSKYSIFSN